jgi:hypothetical protein
MGEAVDVVAREFMREARGGNQAIRPGKCAE